MATTDDLQGAWAVVTGASEGIGRIFAQELAKLGFKILAVARNEERLKTLMTALGAGHRYVTADLQEAAGVALVERIMNEVGARVLVNNAGFGLEGLFTDQPLEKQLGIIRVNVEALTILSHAFLKRAGRGDALINVASVVGLMPYPAQPVYSASKAYVTFFTEALWQRYSQRGIYIQNLCPGSTKTQFFARSREGRVAKNHAFMQEPQDVVAVSLKAWQRHKAGTIISGFGNRLGYCLAQLLPRRAVAKLMGVTE